MIEFGTDKTKQSVSHMWQTVFRDSDEFTKIYFAQKYKNENTLVYFVEGEPVASLQLWEYEFSFYNNKIPVYYFAGLCTYENHRRKGYMSLLMQRAHEVMKERNIPLCILIPAQEWLFTFYEQFGYAHVFHASHDDMSLKEIVQTSANLETAFKAFDNLYNKTDFTVLKDFEQFRTIVEEQELTNYETKTNLDAAARIIDAEYLLKIYAKSNPERRFTIKVMKDMHIRSNNTYYTIEDGVVSKFANAIADFQVDILELCELLMGQHNEEFNNRIISKFPKHHPIINLMLE